MSKKLTVENNKKNTLWIALHEFSYAEFSSAIEMLQAAKRSNDSKISKGFIRHALDEYRHTRLMRTIISKHTEDNPDCFRDVRFCSNHAIKKGYVDSSEFLFQKYNLQRFSIFVGINEQSASRIFTKFRERCADVLKKSDVNNRDQESYICNISLASETIGRIIEDEENHEKFALGYARRNVEKWKLARFLMWEKVCNRVRHFYASNKNINKWVAAFVYFLVITLIIPFRFVFSLNSSEMKTLISNDNADLML